MISWPAANGIRCVNPERNGVAVADEVTNRLAQGGPLGRAPSLTHSPSRRPAAPDHRSSRGDRGVPPRMPRGLVLIALALALMPAASARPARPRSLRGMAVSRAPSAGGSTRLRIVTRSSGKRDARPPRALIERGCGRLTERVPEPACSPRTGLGLEPATPSMPRKWSPEPLRKRENRAATRFLKPSAGLEPATPSLPWKCSTN
jgi:hypothetical protein